MPQSTRAESLQDLCFTVYGYVPICLAEWVRLYEDEWIRDALDATQGKARNHKYTWAILQRWKREGKPEKKVATVRRQDAIYNGANLQEW